MRKHNLGEAEFKAELLNHFRDSGKVGQRGSVLISELAVCKHERRADVVIVDEYSTCIEIKTHRDVLVRLDDQISTFSSIFDRVYVACATKHTNAVLSRVPAHVGVIELVEFGGQRRFDEVRAASASPLVPLALVESLPLAQLRELLGYSMSGWKRKEFEEAALNENLSELRTAFRKHLTARYGASSRLLFSKVRRRKIRPHDLTRLRIWAAPSGGACPTEEVSTTQQEWAIFKSIRECFGPVPEDIRTLMVG